MQSFFGWAGNRLYKLICVYWFWFFALKCSISVFLYGFEFPRFTRPCFIPPFLFYDLSICVSSYWFTDRPGLLDSERPNVATCIMGCYFAKCIVQSCRGWRATFSIRWFAFVFVRFVIFKCSMFAFLCGFEFPRFNRLFCVPPFRFYNVSICVSLYWFTNRPGFFGWENQHFAICIIGCHYARCIVRSFCGWASDRLL